MKKIIETISSLEELINNNFLYIDKTKEIYDLFAQGHYYFFARPRRFGKTLLISTLEELFKGNRELFKGLWIDSSDYTWEPHAVISFDFSTLEVSNPEDLKKSLIAKITMRAQEHSIDLSAFSLLGDKLELFIRELAKKNKLVLLVDEYDFPVISNIHNPVVLKGNLEVLKSFFTLMKGFSKFFRAIFITGVSQIPKASIFTGLSNLTNISLEPIAAKLLGYTKEEVENYFSQHIAKLAEQENMSYNEVIDKIQQWYNGYRFSEKDIKVYNPFSLHSLFRNNKFNNYWFQSATPSFLLKILKKNEHIILEDIGESRASSSALQSIALEDPQLVPLLFQTGYLTITGYDYDGGRNYYTLNYPNHEVRESYSKSLLEALTKKSEEELDTQKDSMRKALLTNNMEDFCRALISIFASLPYPIENKTEAAYHQSLCFIMRFVGFSFECEVTTNKGKIDMVIHTPQYLYVVELKINASANRALNQIERKGYYELYLSHNKTIVLLGIAFNKKDNHPTITYATKILP